MLINLLLVFVPVALAMEYVFHAPPLWIFGTAILAIVPLADWMRKGTEHLSHHLGQAVGGLLNVSFGNAAELILAMFVLAAGHQEVVKAQITGSIIGNSLLGLGLAIVAGSFGRPQQLFQRERASMLGSMLILVVIALLIPALFDYTERGLAGAQVAEALDHRLSLTVSIVLILVYAANLVYTLGTHKDVFALPASEGGDDAHHGPVWSLPRALGILVAATVTTAIMAELVSGALEASAETLGLSTFFLGIIVLAVVGNAAEYISAVYFARRDRMGLVMTITVGATIQIALFVAPVLVIASHVMGRPMSLVFANPLELIAVAAVAFAVNAIAHDGEVTWFEGVLLLTVYVLFGIAFYFVSA